MEHKDKTVNECFYYNSETRAQVNKLEERHDKLAERVFLKLDDIEKSLLISQWHEQRVNPYRARHGLKFN